MSLLSKTYNFINFVTERVGYLVFGKVFSLTLIGLMVFSFPESFETYARVSISSALFSAVLVIGLPYLVQLWSQDIKEFNASALWNVSLFFSIFSFLTLYTLSYDLLSLLSVIIIGVSPFIMSHLTEVAPNRLSHSVHFLLILLSQPLIFLLSIVLPDIELRALNYCFYAILLAAPFSVYYLLTTFSNYKQIFILQSLTILVGSGLVSFLLADIVLEDEELQAGFLWVLIQFASVLIFLSNSLSFRLISYFSSSSNRKGVFTLGNLVYMYLCIFLLILFLVVYLRPEFAYFSYALYVMSQGIAKVAGSAVLSLRKPSLQFSSALGSLLFLVLFLGVFGQDQVFHTGVLALLASSFGGGIVMYLMLKKIKSTETTDF